MLAKRQHQIDMLNLLEIPLFRARVRNDCKNPIYGAQCLVLLPQEPKESEPEVFKILQGMLKVLTLEPEQICIAWVNPAKVDNTDVAQMLSEFAPYHILVMDQNLQSLVGVMTTLEIPFMVTYSPWVLAKEATLKAKAYQDLLKFKEFFVKTQKMP